MKRIPLRARDGSVRAYAVVDDEDYEWLNQWRWSLVEAKTKRYARRNMTIDGRLRHVKIHRLIMGLAYGDKREVDHRDGDGLNNRRSNLLVTTHAQNQQNRQGAQVNSSSGVRGVHWDETRKRWIAVVAVGGRAKRVGRYQTLTEAKTAVAVYRAEHMPFSREATDGVAART